jgi:glycosyltransferase involved in cell wall biosynthesis
MHAGRIRAFGKYDQLVISGMGLIDAFLSGRPYAYWPNGGDLRLLPFRNGSAYDRFVAAAMREAVRGASLAGTQDPTLVDCYRALGRHDVPFLPFLVDPERYAPVPDAPRSEIGREVKRQAADRRIVLLAARQDVYWKATDRFARAFVRAVAEGARIFAVVCPWGSDTDAIRALMLEGARDAVVFLDRLPSKPLLIDLYSMADVVVDQFALGAYGATMLEAMACATPVLISLDVARFRSYWPDYTSPPVVNATEEAEIVEALRQLDSGAIDSRALGDAAREWVAEHHGIAQAERFVLR